jgi:AcrR family transcriptional regulator
VPVSDEPELAWVQRAAERSPAVQRSRARSTAQAKQIVAAAQRLLTEQGGQFTTHQLVKEAGVALRTFYRYFASKDELLLAVLEVRIADAAEQLRQGGASIADPVERLRYYIVQPLQGLSFGQAGGREITAEHWRLHQLYPAEVEQATGHITDLLEEAIEEAAAVGSLHPVDPRRDAWTITKMVMTVFHHYVYAEPDADLDAVRAHLWQFCCTGLGVDRRTRSTTEPRRSKRKEANGVPPHLR